MDISLERIAAAAVAIDPVFKHTPQFVCEGLSAELGRPDEGLNLLRGYLEKYPSLDALNVVFQGTLEQHGPEHAYKLVRVSATLTVCESS